MYLYSIMCDLHLTIDPKEVTLNFKVFWVITRKMSGVEIDSFYIFTYFSEQKKYTKSTIILCQDKHYIYNI